MSMPQDLHESKVMPKESKHARYYARHHKEHQAQSREYKQGHKFALKEAPQQSLVIETGKNTNSISPPSMEVPLIPVHSQLLVRGEEMTTHSMYQDFITLQNKIDNWVECTMSCSPAVKTCLLSNFLSFLFASSALAMNLHLFIDKYRDTIPYHYLNVPRFHKSVNPDMALPQPNWAGVTFWVPQDSSPFTATIHKRLLVLRLKADRFNGISVRLTHFQLGQWTYEETEQCIQLGQNLYMEWYTVLDDLDDNFTSTWGIQPFLKEMSCMVYKIGQTLEKLTYTLLHLLKC
ncbi:hypothetical protein GYMLUDRAFT_61262 [Collybiopsis luxurians FD-317 M1]|uniref:Uncharacterized protein n=1 Tax=Collybiopsis luxurians FD-317 M1 TaxID=944289 RepID=A0A0D0B2Y5_9AGAR|nr:hypothetical protein GYMLUDRAFT_61262 [Collybiopsis luxurians FD-317 M1]